MGQAQSTADRGDSQWWRGNLHAHSLWSDGSDFPEMASDRYKRQGYHFLALTEHDQLALGERWMALSDPRVTNQRLDMYAERFGESWVQMRDGAQGREVRLKPVSYVVVRGFRAYNHRGRREARGMLLYI